MSGYVNIGMIKTMTGIAISQNLEGVGVVRYLKGKVKGSVASGNLQKVTVLVYGPHTGEIHPLMIT